MPTSKEALNVVQDLYLLHIDLQKFLEHEKADAEEHKRVRKNAKEFSSLLKKADWRYMGGEDVLEGLRETEKEVTAKLKQKRQKAAARKR